MAEMKYGNIRLLYEMACPKCGYDPIVRKDTEDGDRWTCAKCGGVFSAFRLLRQMAEKGIKALRYTILPAREI